MVRLKSTLVFSVFDLPFERMILTNRFITVTRANLCCRRIVSFKNSFELVKFVSTTHACLHATPEEAPLLRQLKSKIKLTGPITVADYMRQVLTNSHSGYYMHKDVFGTEGDFITSPEISQMFGELIAVWCVNEWMQLGSRAEMQVVELGPGRGTLADDMLRVFSKFEGMRDAVSLHLVEVSPWLSGMQRARLCGEEAARDVAAEGETVPYRSSKTKYGTRVHWYRQLEDVPKAFSFFVAHEFLDALPIHKFQYKDGEWHEVLIDIDSSPESGRDLRWVLSKQRTAANELLTMARLSGRKDHVELCLEAGLVVQQLATRICEDGGFALLADYGHSGEKGDTFRAFRKHQLHDALLEPGSADLTADVDFSYLKYNAEDKVKCCGPITQQEFLQNMGISVRLQMLMKNSTEAQQKELLSAYDMLTNINKMGERFKFFALLHRCVESYQPAGFVPPQS